MRWRPSWELAAVGAVLAAYGVANGVIQRQRPTLTRSATALVDSVLRRDRSVLDQDLNAWRAGMLDDGRWLATLAGVALDAHQVGRLAELTQGQIPGARVWVLDSLGRVQAASGGDAPTERHRWLARYSLRRDSTMLIASELRGRDLRLAVGSPVRGRGLVAVLDVSAAERLGTRMPRLALAGHAGRAALTFPMGRGFVGTTWSGHSDDPQVVELTSGWSLTDKSLITVWGALPDTTPRFELGLPRAAAQSLADARIASWRATAALIVLPLCLGVMMIGRTMRARRLHAAEWRTAQAELAATRAGLAAAQARLNPHFLSNALHSVSALVDSDPDAAEDALERLGDLFRYSLDQRTVRLDDEWRFVGDYLAIERMRFGPRLTMEMVLDPAAAGCEVPSFTLQPLVENAIRHGIGPRRQGGTVRVCARRVGDRLELVVADDGVGAQPGAVDASAGTGLRTLRERLALDPGLDGRVEIVTAPGAGFQVRVTVSIAAP